MLTRHPLSQEFVRPGTGAKQELPERIPWMELAASAAHQGTTVLRVPPTPRAPQLFWEGEKVPLLSAPCSPQILFPDPHTGHNSSAL